MTRAQEATAPPGLSGQVVDALGGEPIAFVTVRIAGTHLATETDAAGHFVFQQVPPGSLVILAGGGVIETTSLAVSAGARNEPVVVEATYQSEPEVTVTVIGAPPRPRTASLVHLTAREMAAVPRRTAEDALRLVPGFTLVQHGSEGKGHQFFLRGFDAVHGADLELRVEGIPVNEWSNIHAQGYIDLGFVIAETVQSVEVVKGPFTLGQGAFAMAGSADYQLGIPEADRGVRSSYTIGTTNRQRALATYSPRDGDGKDFVALEMMHDDGFGQNREIDRGVALGRIQLIDSERLGTLSLLGSGYLARFALPGTLRAEDVQAGRLGFYDAYDRAGRGFSGRAIVGLSHQWKSGEHFLRSSMYAGYRRLALLENYTGFLLDPVNGDRRRQRQSSWSLGFSSVYDLVVTDRLALHLGVGFRGDALKQVQTHVDQEEAFVAAERQLEGFQSLSNAMLGVLWRPVESFRLAFGTRLDLAQVFVRDGLAEDKRSSAVLPPVLSPRATAEWKVSPAWRLFAAFGRGFRPPEARAFTSYESRSTGISENVYAGGGPAMAQAHSFEVGTRWDAHRFVRVISSGFATLIDRESIFDHVSGVNLQLNGTRRLGGELALSSRPLDWLTLKADITYVDARFVESGDAIPLVPSLVGGFRVVATHESGFRAGLRSVAWASRSLPHGARGSATATADATAGYSWDFLRLDLELENILNQRIREGEYHYASSWSATGGPSQEPSALPVVHTVAGPPINARLTLTALF